MNKTLLFVLLMALPYGVTADEAAHIAAPMLYRKIVVPESLCAERTVAGKQLVFGGDIRIGDLSGNGQVEFLVYRSVDNAHDGGGMKPCFMAAFDQKGNILWQTGEGGEQPTRPGPVAIYDIDGDKQAEVLCFFVDNTIEAAPDSCQNVVVQIRDGKTGAVKCEAAPDKLRACKGRGPNWAHQRILIANLRGRKSPRDFVIKLGDTLLAFNEHLEVIWDYPIRWNEYGHCCAYTPAVGDMDNDGRDEINGGYFLLDEDGTPLWEKPVAPHTDSVCIAEWDNSMRAFCSGHGHVMSKTGAIILKLGGDVVPHGQELRVARFCHNRRDPQMAIRYNGHTPDVILVDTQGTVLNKLQLNATPNNTGMEPVYWNGIKAPALLCNGQQLWQLQTGESKTFPELPAPVGTTRAGWYHCLPANVCGDTREEVVLYNPWDRKIYIYTPQPFHQEAYTAYSPGPRQYNPRIMD